MMQESSHRPIPVLAHQNWSIKSCQSGVGGLKKGSSTTANDIKRPDVVMNGLHHKELHLNNISSSSRLDAGECTPGKEVFPNSKATRVKWTVKNITRKEDGKQLSNISSWLSTQKLDDKATLLKSSTGGSGAHQMTSGFDLAKLYPELSSKLGLIKSVPSEASSDKCPVVSGNKSLQSVKGTYNVPRNSGISSNEFHEVNNKNTANIKAINSNALKSSSFYHDKIGGSFNSLKSRSISLNNDMKKNPSKHKEKLDLTKLSEDKLRKLISCQALNNKIPLSSPVVSKCDTKTSKAPNRSKPTTVSLFDAMCDKTFPTSFVSPYGSGNSLKPNNITILPRHSPPPPLPNHSVLSPTQLRVHNIYQDYYAYKSNLFPLGYGSSESDTSDEELGESITTTRDSLVRCREETTLDPSISHNPTLLQQPYRQQVLTARERLQLHENGLKRRWALTRALLEAARANPDSAASTVAHFVKKLHSDLPSKKKHSRTRSSLLVTRHCVYEGESGAVCNQRALPGTRHCLRHITYNVDQQLFSQCAAKKDDNSLCRIPTLNLLHDFPLCSQHASHSMTAVVTPAEASAKAKRARKKSKMPVLSRYGKRNKKRRRSSFGSSSIVPSTSVRPPINSPGVCLSSPHSTSPLTPHTSPTFSTPCSDPAGGGDESELEDEFEGMVGSLPLEARDLQDVLNKIPEHEISQILYGADGKICDGSEEEDRKNRVGSVPKAPEPSLNPLCLDEGALGELISSSFNQQELNTISQVLSNMVSEEGLDLGGDFHQETQEPSTVVPPPFHSAPEPPPTPPVYLSDDSNSASIQSSSSPPGIPSPVGGSNSLLHPNSKLKVNPTL